MEVLRITSFIIRRPPTKSSTRIYFSHPLESKITAGKPKMMLFYSELLGGAILLASIAFLPSANANRNLRGSNVTMPLPPETDKYLTLINEKPQGVSDEENRYIVVYKNDYSVKMAMQKEGAPQTTITYLPKDKAEVKIIDSIEELNKLKERTDVEYIEKDHKIFLQQDSNEKVPYGIDLVQSLNVPDEFVSNRKVCIIDTGYDSNHLDLPSVDTGSNITGVAAGNLDPFKDGNGHGTHVAGTIAAVANNNVGVVGVIGSGRINLHIVRVFDDRGRFVWSSSLVSAVEECVTQVQM